MRSAIASLTIVRHLALAGLIAILSAMAPQAHAEAWRGREIIKEIGGETVSCRDSYGLHVHAVLVTDLGDVGRARNLFKTPVIMMDPSHLIRLPGKLQLFFFGHECAHHVLGHTYVLRPSAESEADCWAAKDGRARGLFTRDDVQNWAPWFANSRGSAISGHLPGPERAKFILQCFDEPETAASTTVTQQR